MSETVKHLQLFLSLANFKYYYSIQRLKMKKIYLILILTMTVMLAGCATIANTGIRGNEEAGSEPAYKYDDFAQCLTSKGIKMYGTEWCGYCKMQKGYFNESFQHVDYVNCEEDNEACQEAGIQGYPTWIINGELSPGAKPLDKLAELSGCELPV